MNKNLFRIIFNKRRGQLMAVAETSSSQGRGTRGETDNSGLPPISGRAAVAISVIGFAVLCALGAVLWALPTPVAHAQVVAYRQAPGNQQPTILQTANGLPQVNIQTPSATGVSRNVYSQFDVESKGVILNNSHANVQTQQGGWVQANPWLATGSARVILNEVNASNPSLLNGYVEVAGQRAEVVIANPAGISVNGGGFINTSKATLTTGTPIVNTGSLDGYRVQGGNISIYGKGLDLSSTDYAAILARAVQVNAGIWANELKVLTGANQIDASSLAANTTPVATTIAGTGAVPSFALDVAQIGGMYAGKIHLIGTEQGLGVRSAGTLGSNVGDLVLQNNGWLTTTGNLQASENLQITTQGDIHSSGTLYARNDQTINANGNITNSGFIAAQGNTSITANSFSSITKSVVGAGVKDDGTSSSNGNLNVATTQVLATNGQNLAAGNMTLTGSSVDLSGSQTGAANITISANSGSVTTANATVATTGTTGVLAVRAKTNSDQTLDNTQGVLSAGQLNLEIANFNNTQGKIIQTGVGNTVIALTSPTSTFNNTSGSLTVNSANVGITASTLTNTDGKIQHAGSGTLSITADSLSSEKGQVASNSYLDMTVATQLNNTDGVLSAGRDLNISAGFGAAQPSGLAGLNNTRGVIQSTSGSLDLSVENLDNTKGSVYAHSDLSLVSSGAITNTGFIAAQGNATLSANSLSSSSTGVLAAGIKADGTLANSGDLNITTTQALDAHGQNLAAGKNTLSGSNVNLSGSQTGGANIDITATSGDVNTANATVATPGTLSILAKTHNNQTLNNTQGVLSAGQFNADVANLNNSYGQITQTGTGDTTINLTSPTSTFNNTGGTLAINSANLSLSANTLINTDGKIQHAGVDSLHITVNTLNDQRGKIVSNNALVIDAGVIDHRSASTTAKNITLTGTSLNNNQGEIVQTGNGAMGMTINQELDNTAGTVASNGKLTVVAQSLTNNQGQVSALGDLTVNLNATQTAGAPQNAGALSNLQGLMAANGHLAITAISVDNTLGTLASVDKNISVTTTGATNNDSGKIQAALDITLTNVGLSNTRTANALATSTSPYGSIIGRNIDINTNTQTLNNTGGTIAANQSANLQTGALSNDGGLIQTGKDLVINTHGQSLTNTHAANYTSSNTALNGKGGIASQGTSTFTTGDLNNDAGYIGSQGALTANTANIHNTLGGQIQGLANLSLTAGNGTTLGTINSTGGLIRSAATATLSAGTVTNSNTLSTTPASSNTNLGIEGKDVSIATATLSNNSGAIRADNNITITSAGTVNNNAGLMSAGNTLTLQDVQTQNSQTLAIKNTDGTLIADKVLTVTASNLAGDGKVLSKGNLNLTLNTDFTNSGQVIANGNANLTTTGNITNNAKLQAGNTLNLAANNINNTVTGEISANTTQVKANNTLTNRGLIDGVETQINADKVNNIGTGRIYGDHISIEAVNLTNDTETIAGVTKAGAIAARDRLDLGISGTLTNREHALIYSVGDMAIGGGLDANRRATGAANSVNNKSATIEAGRDLSLNSLNLNNTNEHFTTEIVKISGPTSLLYIQPAGTTNKIWAQNFVFEGWSRAGQYRFKTTPPINDSAVLGASPVPRVGEQNCTGSDADEVCTRIAGADYPRTDPAWAYFKVNPPATEPAKPNLTVPVPPDLSDANTCQAGANYNASACSDYNNALNQYNTSKSAYDTAWSSYNTAHATWQTETEALYTTLDNKIEIYNNSFAGAVIRTWTQYAVTNTQSKSRVASSDPGQILSGRNITLRGTNLINDKSRIVSGGLLDGDLGNLNNVQGQGVHITNEVGTSQYTTSQWRGGFKRYHQRNWDGAIAYAPPDDVQSITLAVTDVRQNTTPTGSGLQVATRGSAVVSTSIDSAGNTSFRNNTIAQSQASTKQFAASHLNQAQGSQVSSQTTQIQTLQGFSIRSTSANTTLPNTSLYKTNPGANTLYLVETDPRFINNKTWLGSDYMSKSLSLDPTVTQKRLGDGFYEQKLIREQVAELTGRRFLADYTSDEQEYKALMDSGITFAKQYKLRPGIALTAQQIAQLTSDIVWLVEQTVTLHDGSSQKVLVPQVYVKVQPGDLDGTGTLLAGKDIKLNLSGDLTNTGNIAGRNVVKLTAENVNNLGGRIGGNDVSVAARQDLNNIGGSISAVSSLSATAGRDLNNETTTQSGANTVGASSFSRTSIDRVAGLYVSGSNGTLVASAGRDLNIVAGVVSNTGTGATSLKAGNNLNLQALTTGQSQNIVGTSNRHTSNQVTKIQAGGNLTINATNNVNLEGSNVDAQGDFKLTSDQGSVNLKAMVDTASSNSPALQNQSQDIKGVQIKTGGNALIQAIQGDIQAQSLQLQAGQKATITADAGKVDLSSEQAYSKTQAGSDVRQSLVTQRTQIVGGSGVEVYGQQSVNIVSADIKATSGQAKATSAGDVTLGFNTDTKQHNWTTTSSSSSWGGLKTKTTTTQHETLDKTAQVTAISGDQVVVLGKNVKSEGAKLEGAQLLQVEGANNTQLFAVQDVHQSTQNSQTSSGLLGVTYSKRSSTDTTLKSEALGTQLSSNKAIQIGVGAVTDVQGAILTAPKVAFVRSAGADTSKAGELILGGSTNTTQTSHTEKTTTAGVWQAQLGHGEAKQTMNQTQIKGQVNTASGISTTVVLPEGNLKTQVQTLSQQPGMSYLNDLSKDSKVNWGQVKLVYDKWDYKQEGLTPAGAILLTIAVTAATGGMGAELAGAASTSTAAGVATTTTTMAGTTLATTVGATTTYTAAGAALNAGFSALAAQASVSLANNGGDIGKTLKELGSSNTVKNTLVAMSTAGVGTSVAGQGVSAVAAQTAAGCASGAVTGAGCEQGAKTAAVLSTAGETYQALVGYSANAGPGENRNGTKLDGTSTNNPSYEPVRVGPNIGQQQAVDRGMNVIGFNDPEKIGSIGAQGGALSRALNQVPTINSTAGLHDYIFNAYWLEQTPFNNAWTMPVSAVVSIPAALNNPNISWMTQVKLPDALKTPVVQSVIRINANPLRADALVGEQK